MGKPAGDVVARLLAYEIARHDNPEVILQNFADGTNHQIYATQKRLGKEPGPAVVAFQEQIQAEIDWIVAAAREMAKD